MIFVTGDTHGSTSLKKLNTRHFPQNKDLIKDDVVIILGDYGLLWKSGGPDNEEKYWTNWYNEKNFTTLFIDGNHENFERLNALPKVNMFGSKVGKVSDSIFHLLRGNIYEIAGKKILTIGGAESTDTFDRLSRIDWWEEENLCMKDLYNALDNLEKYEYQVDYVLSHTCPTEVFQLIQLFSGKFLHKQSDPNMKELQRLKEKIVSFEQWYFGHFHIDKKLGHYFTAVFNSVIQI